MVATLWAVHGGKAIRWAAPRGASVRASPGAGIRMVPLPFVLQLPLAAGSAVGREWRSDG